MDLGMRFGGSNITGNINATDNSKVHVGDVHYHNLPLRRTTVLKSLATSRYKDAKDRNADRVPGTCEWFLAHRFYNQWRNHQSSSLLIVSADPGCGKSVLAKHLADKELPTTSSSTTCYFFFKDDFEDQRTAKSALRCLLHQLFIQRQCLLTEETINYLESCGNMLLDSISELWSLLVRVSRDANAGDIVCILDAYDECRDAEREELTKALCHYYASTNNDKNLKILITSRPYYHIRRGFETVAIPGFPVIHLRGDSEEETNQISQEINLVIKAEVKNIGKGMRLGAGEEELLLTQLLRVPNRTYLWAFLTLRLVQEEICMDKTKIRAVTSQVPKTVDEAYERILRKSHNQVDARKLLHIVVAATRPLTLAEMDVALGLRENQLSYREIDFREEGVLRDYVRNVCGLFVNIIGSKVYLLHQTAREFLVDGRVGAPKKMAGSLEWKHSLRPCESHGLLAHMCMRYLLLIEHQDDFIPTHVFLHYAATNWFLHARISGHQADASMLKLCGWPSFCDPHWFGAAWENGQHDPLEKPHLSPLGIAAFCGLSSVVGFLLQQDPAQATEVDQVHRRSALSWASEGGFADIVELLINDTRSRFRRLGKRLLWMKSDVEEKSREGRTPLAYAALHGHSDVVKTLLDAGALVNSQDKLQGTPLSYAVCSGNQEVMGLLLGDQQDPGVQMDIDNSLTDILYRAIERGQMRMAELVLETGRVRPREGSKARYLCAASYGGHEALTRFLLDQGTNPCDQDRWGRMPLHEAVENGHQSIVELLLSKGADPNAQDGTGTAPLSVAMRSTHSKHWNIVGMLLGKGANPYALDGMEQHLLYQKAGEGNHILTELLLRKCTDLDALGARGRTLLHWAAREGNDIFAELLLDKGAYPDTLDSNGETPLHQAAQHNHRALAGLLLDRGADPNARKGEKTPLHYAAEHGNHILAELLLDRGADPNARESGKTPLHYTAEQGNHILAELLLDRGADPNTQSNNGETPLHRAVWSDHALVGLLLDRGADPNTQSNNGETPLHRAIWSDHTLVGLLLDKGADPNALDGNGETPLSISLEENNRPISDLLAKSVGLIHWGTGELTVSLEEGESGKTLALDETGSGQSSATIYLAT